MLRHIPSLQLTLPSIKPFKLAFVPIALSIGLSLQACQPKTATPAKTPEEIKAVVYQQINEIRQQNGLQPLQRNQQLEQVAQDYSEQMAAENFFDHKDRSGREAAQRVQTAGLTFTLIGENLHRCTNIPNPAQDAIQGWMNSPGHRENILRPVFTETGVGVRRIQNTYYFTQLFMQP